MNVRASISPTTIMKILKTCDLLKVVHFSIV